MYKIIGADQKEYGPVTSDQIRHWIAESRVNAQTRVRAADSQEWQLLSALPEFAEAFGVSASTSAPPAAAQLQADAGRDAALQAVKGPAIALKATAILGLLIVVVGLVFNVLTLAGIDIGIQQFGDPQLQRIFSRLGGAAGIIENIIGGAVGVVILMGARRMQALEKYQLAYTTSILAMLPCISPCCLFGLPFGIWALVVLNRPEVKAQFT
ncbi:MAG: DUF4339 domain-containing protein [Verrucomicrobiota bacterium]|jgi:hypothetical protein